MNMRQHKRFRTAQILALWANVFLGRRLIEREAKANRHAAFTDAEIDAFLTPANHVEEAKVEYVCVKVNGGDVVDTFDTREDALALVLKHAKQRKAKLQVLNSLTGQLEVFAEDEVAA